MDTKFPNLGKTTCGSSNKFNNSNFNFRTNVAPAKKMAAKCFFSHSIQPLKNTKWCCRRLQLSHFLWQCLQTFFAHCYRPPLQYPNLHGLTQRAKPAIYTATKKHFVPTTTTTSFVPVCNSAEAIKHNVAL